jgi:hypothetical protein
MNISEWLDLKTLKLLSQHTSVVAGAAASFWAISKLIRWAAGAGTFSGCVEYGERVVLAVLLLWFTYQMCLVLWKGRARLQNDVQIRNVVA